MRAGAAVAAIFGPTAVGKTAVAIGLAERLRAAGEDPLAISADAYQVYRGLERLTGAPTAAECAALEHRLVGIVPVSEPFSVGRYARLAHAEIDAALDAGRRPIVVGGTGLYMRAALADLDLLPPPPPELRARIERELAAGGPKALHARIARLAPERARRIEPGDRSRIVRTLELLEMEALDRDGGASQLWSARHRRPTLLFGLVMARHALYRRIDARVEAIARAGAAEEVRAAVEAGASPTAAKALGFDELLSGDLDGMRRRTRRYARRQLTWLRKMGGVTLVDVTGREPAVVGEELAVRLSAGPPRASR